MRTAITCSILAATTLLVSLPALGQDYFPLDPGWTWTYARSGGGGEMMVEVTGTLDVFGVPTTVRHNVVVGADEQTFDNYWSRDAEGRVLLHGAFNESGFLAFYDPPIVWIEAPPLAVDDTWCTDYLFYHSLDDPAPSGPYQYCCAVYAAQSVTVPAGTFDAFAVDAILPPLAGNDVGYGLLGNRIAGRDTYDHPFYADGIGMVVAIVTVPYELTSYSGPVRVQTTAWGAVKALFAD